MILKTMRNNLSVALAVLSAVMAGYAVITQLHYDIAVERLKVEEHRNSLLTDSIREQAKTIETLTKQRLIDDKILRLLAEQQVSMKTQTDDITKRFKELANNDKAIHDLFSMRLPPDAVRLLREQTDNPNED